MDNYENTKHKLKVINDKLEQSQNDYDNLKKEKINTISLNYNANQSEYLVYDSVLSNLLIFKITLNNFPEELLPYIRIISIVNNPVLTSVSAVTEIYIIPTAQTNKQYCYIFFKRYVGSTSLQLKISLKVQSIQTYNQV